MEELAPLIALVRKSNRISAVLGVVMMIVGGGLFAIPAKTDKDLYIKLGIMAFFVGLGITLLIMGLRAPEKARGIRVLAERAHEIVWIYVLRRFRNRQHVGSFLEIGLVDGQKASLPLAIGREDELQALAASRAPRARVGYDAKLEAQFKRSPASLRDGDVERARG